MGKVETRAALNYMGTTHRKKSKPPLLIVEETEQSPEYEELLAQITSAIQKLPQLTPDEPGLGAARNYARHLISYRPLQDTAAAHNYRRRNEIVGRKTTKHEITMFQMAAEKLLAKTSALHAPARQVLGLTDTLRRRPGFALEEKLKELIERATSCNIQTLPNIAGQGRKEAARVTRFTREIGKIFYLYTNKKPTMRTNLNSTAYGPWLEFVTEIFAILNIEASAEAQARKFMDKINQKR